MLAKLRHEPLVLAALARITVALGARFGLNVTVDDLLLILGAVEVVAVALSRGQVTPNAKVAEQVARASMVPPEPVNVPVVDAGEDLETTPVERGKKP